MYTKKKVLNNVFNTVMIFMGKTKDNVKTRFYMKELCKFKELKLMDGDNRRMIRSKA